jgi:hypothetical protein
MGKANPGAHLSGIPRELRQILRLSLFLSMALWILAESADRGIVRTRTQRAFTMSIRGFALFALKTVAVLSVSAMPMLAGAQPSLPYLPHLPHDATGVATSVVLTVTTPLTISFGQSVDGFAQVNSSDSSALMGTVTFYDGAANICVIPVAQGSSCSSSTGTGFAVGAHVLTAVYSGDAIHSGSTSNAVTVTVLAAATPTQTATMLASNANPAIMGQSLTFTANVVLTGQSTGTPTGVVNFLDGGMVLGSGTLNTSGVASFSTSSLAPGSHRITASYAGDGTSAASVSAAITEVVSSPGTTTPDAFTLTVTGTATMGIGKVANLAVTVVPQNGYAGPVQLSCADLPFETACTFGAMTIPAGGGTTTLQLSTMAPHDCGSTPSSGQTSALPLGGTTVAGLLLLFLPAKRRRAIKGLLVALIAIYGMTALTGCGLCTDFGTRPGSYTIKVVGTSVGAGSSSVVTTKVKMDVVVQ